MDRTTYTVPEVAAVVGQAVSRAFPDEIWVQGEIRDLSRASSGHVYFTLVDPETDDNATAMLPVTLFQSDKIAVNRVLARSGAVRMTDGVEVRIRGRISHYAARGTVQLRMTWIDTDFTVGKLAAERERLIRSLQARGLLEMNSAIPVAPVPLRVGLITSVGSAAHADFVDELARSGYAWEVGVVDARVQGPDAVADVVGALGVLGGRVVDVIALVRGGGAQTDLAAFDAEAIALAIAECPIPVLTGIGHEIDVSVADLVARNYKTPTACAAGLVGAVASFVAALDRVAAASARAAGSRLALASALLDHATSRLQRSAAAAGSQAVRSLIRTEERVGRAGRALLAHQRRRTDDVSTHLHRAAQHQLLAATSELDRLTMSVQSSADRATSMATARLEDLDRRLSLLDPAMVLARGWSITRNVAGNLVTDPGDVAAGSVLRTTVAAGEITSVVSADEEVTNG